MSKGTMDIAASTIRFMTEQGVEVPAVDSAQTKRAAVMGAGTIDLLATLALRLRGVEVATFALAAKPNPNAELLEELGSRYFSTKEIPVKQGAKFGPFDVIFV